MINRCATGGKLNDADKALDVICMGRAAVDLYGAQIGETLEDMSSFRKYLGGSSANMAIGMARLGLKAAMLTRVGNEQMGRFVRRELAANGVDVGHVVTDPARLTGLAILAVRDRDTFPLVFYRENCADMAIGKDDFDEAFIASARALVITGTHFSSESTGNVCRKAVQYARRNGTGAVLDIDYRPVLWGLTAPGLGEVRFVGSGRVTEHLQSMLPLFNVIVGTEEEIHIAGGATDTVAALRRLRDLTPAVLVVKRGLLGASVFPDAIADTLDDGITVAGMAVDVLNVLGAGDAFMSGFMRGWVAGESYATCCRYANACGALVVSRHGCAPAMPGSDELRLYLAAKQHLRRPDEDPALTRLHRASTRSSRRTALSALAFDHRPHLADLADSAGAGRDRIPALKNLIHAGLCSAVTRRNLGDRAGMIVDERFGAAVLLKETGAGLWVARAVELPGSRPLRFETGDGIGLQLQGWPRGHLAKCLVRYHPDDSAELKRQQERTLLALYDACLATDRELLLEVILPTAGARDDQTMAQGVDCLYQAGIFPDWWKLAPQSEQSWALIAAAVARHDSTCRGVLVLGSGVPENELGTGFEVAARQPLCKGFAVGRTIFSAAARAWLSGQADDESTVATIAHSYLRVVDAWTGNSGLGAPVQDGV